MIKAIEIQRQSVRQLRPAKTSKNGYSRAKVTKEVTKIVEDLKEKGFSGQIMISLNYGGNQWYSGKFTDIQTQNPDIFHLDNYGNENLEDPEHYQDFRIYVTKNKAHSKKEPKLKGGSMPEDKIEQEDVQPEKEIFQPHGYSLNESKIIICKRTSNGQCNYFKDDEFFEGKDYDYVNEIDRKPRSSGYLVIKVRDEDNRSLKEIYDEFIETANELKEKTNGKVNLFKTGSITNSSKYHFKNFMKQDIECDTIVGNEAKWISNATTGSLQYATRGYEGEAIGYDVNSFYASILNSNFRIPIKKGTFERMTYDGIFKSHVTYGIYRCTIEGEITPFLFRLNPTNIYTSIDINRAIKLGYEVKYIIDDQPNRILYKKDDFIEAKEIFGEYIEYFYNLKCKGVKGSKLFLTCLWGWLTAKEPMTLSNTGSYDIDDSKEITGIFPLNEDDKVRIIVNKANKMYKHAFARFAPFLLARARELIGLIYEDQIEDVVRVSTDGFILQNELKDANLGDQLGQLKIEKKYCNYIKITHQNLIHRKDENSEWIKCGNN